ncbi:MAG TPA: SprT family zinc-dependent metalloprotease [Candidatus Saccharimonadales bacterium]|nr:SprT family zinc-dependent metalloprotease [Candidatus Saccharimonadales bacterium]
MATKQIQIPEIGTVTLYKRKGNRTLRITIGAGGEVRVSLPYWLPYRAGEQFAMSKANWIAANRTGTSKTLAHGSGIGKAHRLHFEMQAMATKVNARIVSNEVRVSFPAIYSAEDRIVQLAAHKASIRALRKEAAALLPQRLEALAGQTGHIYNGVTIKQLKSRWGSCNSNQEITLNLFLMQLPWHLIDYVLMHELTHTRVMQHGAPFWKAMEEYMPDARQLRKQMSSYQPVLLPIQRAPERRSMI